MTNKLFFYTTYPNKWHENNDVSIFFNHKKVTILINNFLSQRL